jgi:hypothetical protein
MPNHVTNIVYADRSVLESALNKDGHFDFGVIHPFEGSFEWNGVCVDAETAAEAVLGVALNDHPLIAALQDGSRSKVNIKKLDDESFEQFIQMLRNHRKTGYLHCMDFARDKWGTKWNAYDQVIELEDGRAKFDTAWSAPIPIFKALSAKHPEQEIKVEFADEDIGSNCGTMVFKGGELVSQEIADSWNKMNEEQRKKWEAFAYQVKGWEPEEDEQFTSAPSLRAHWEDNRRIAMKLAELERQRIELGGLIKQEKQRHEKQLSELQSKLNETNRLIAASAGGINLDLLKKAESVIAVRGLYEKAGDDRAAALQAAIDDLAAGAPKLRKTYIGTKQYARWYGQYVEHSYGMGPSHGSVIFEIGIRRDQLGRDLAEDEIESCIYYLRNLQAIQAAATKSAA